jgi:hypothetical protein
MTPNDRKEFARILTGLATVKRMELTPEALAIWWNAMADWSIEEFSAAASHLAKTRQWLDPSHFHELRQAHAITTSEAWALVMRTCIHWRNPEHLPKGRIARAVEVIGGYRKIALTDQDELHWLAKRFREAFEDLSDAEETRQALPQLAPPIGALADLRDALPRLPDGRSRATPSA